MIKKLNSIAGFLIIITPMLMITGAFLSDLSVVLIDLMFLLIIFKEKKTYVLNNIYFKYLFALWLYFTIRSVFAEDILLSLKSSFFYIRFIILIYAISFFLERNEKLIKSFFKYLMITVGILCADALFQFVFAVNLLNFDENGFDKLNGLFGDEGVLGSYLLKFSVLIFALINYLEFDKKKYKLLLFIIIIILGIVIFLSGSRSSLFLYIMFLSFLYLVNKNIRKVILNTIGICLIFFFVAGQINNKVYYKISYMLMDPFKTMFDEDVKPNNLKDKEFIIFIKIYHTHYETAYNIFLDNKLFGVGTKMFRIACNDPRFYINKFSCTTHPHNYYIQILAENGIIGFFGFLFIFLRLGYLILRKIILINFKGENNKLEPSLILLIGLFVNLWPIIPTGNFFNNWLSIAIYFPMGFYLYLRKKSGE